MNNEYYDRKIESFFPIGAKVFGFIILVTGALAVLGGFYLALILVAIGSFVSFAYNGLQLALENKSYKEYTGVLGLKFGKFQPLPELSHLTIFNRTTRVTNNLPMGGAQSSSTETSCRVNLKGKDNRFSVSVSNGNKKKVTEDALLLADILLLDIVDITEKERKVIKVGDPVKA